MHSLTPSTTQNTEDGTAHDVDLAALERSPKVGEAKDPFAFRSGVKSEADLAAMRKSKHGKRLESYHRRQNNVRRRPLRASSLTLAHD
jgi:hypothetical protein